MQSARRSSSNDRAIGKPASRKVQMPSQGLRTAPASLGAMAASCASSRSGPRHRWRSTPCRSQESPKGAGRTVRVVVAHAELHPPGVEIAARSRAHQPVDRAVDAHAHASGAGAHPAWTAPVRGLSPQSRSSAHEMPAERPAIPPPMWRWAPRSPAFSGPPADGDGDGTAGCRLWNPAPDPGAGRPRVPQAGAVPATRYRGSSSAGLAASSASVSRA